MSICLNMKLYIKTLFALFFIKYYNNIIYRNYFGLLFISSLLLSYSVVKSIGGNH